MINFFKKKYKNITEYSDTWSLAQGEYQGKPLIVRFRNIQDAKGHPDYQFHLGVVIPFVTKTENGLPEKEESVLIEKIETGVTDLLETGNETVFVLALTTSNMRELVLYAKEWKPEALEKKVNEFNKQFPTYKLQFMMKKDADWSTYKQFVK